MKKLLMLSSELPKKPKIMYVLSREHEDIQLRSIATTYKHVAIELDSERKSSEIYIDGRPADISGVYFRFWSRFPSMSIALANLLRSKKIPFVNSDVGISASDDKSHDYCKIYNDLPLPKTFLAYPGWLIKNSEILKTKLKYPYILKASGGKKGRDNFLVRSLVDLVESLKGYPRDELFCVQEFIPNSFDYRIVIIGFEAKQAYIRTRDPKSKTHVNNASQGASKTDVAINSVPELCAMAEKAAKLLNREVCGVDIVVNSENGKALVLEVNSSPSLPYESTIKMLQTYLKSKVA